MENRFDKVIRKYCLLQKLDSENRLLDYFIKDEVGFLPNLELKEEIIERFGTYYPSAKELIKREKVHLSRIGIMHRLLKNYSIALTRELKRLGSLDKEIMGFWGVEL